MGRKSVKVKELEGALLEAAKVGNLSEVKHITAQIEALRMGNGKVIAQTELSQAEKFILWAINQAKDHPEQKKNGWLGMNPVYPVPGQGYTCNQYLRLKLGLDTDAIKRVTADMVRKNLIVIIPRRRSVTLYLAQDAPKIAKSDPSFDGLPKEFQI